jgi:hypothetical protein
MNLRYRMAEPRRRYELRIVRDAALIFVVLVIFLALATTGYACSKPAIALRGVCQADEDLWVFTARAARTGTLEISWQQDFSFVFDTVDVRKNRTETIYTGEPDTGSVTLFARFVDRHGIKAEAELSERPC